MKNGKWEIGKLMGNWLGGAGGTDAANLGNQGFQGRGTTLQRAV